MTAAPTEPTPAWLRLDYPSKGGSAPAVPPLPGESFRSQFNTLSTPVAQSPAAQANEAAAGLVANALILPVLRQIRRDPFAKNTVFSGGNAEKMFGPEFDIDIAQKIAKSPNMSITKTLAGELLRRNQPVSRVALTKAMGLDTISRPAVPTLDLHG